MARIAGAVGRANHIHIEVHCVIGKVGNVGNADAHAVFAELLIRRQHLLIARRHFFRHRGNRQHHAHVRTRVAMFDGHAGDGNFIAGRHIRDNFGAAAGIVQKPNPTKLRSEDIAHMVKAALEMDDRGFVTELTIFATNPKD